MSQPGKVVAGAGVAVIAAVLLGVLASASFPSGAPSLTFTTTTTPTVAVTSTVIATSTVTATYGVSTSASTASSLSTTTTSVATTNSATVSATTSATSTSTGTTESSTTTSPCGSPGVYCGNIQITSANLTIGASDSFLQVTLLEVGNSYIGSATVYVNGTVIGVPPASQYEPPGNIILNVQPGQQVVLVLTIPSSTLSVQSGRTYSVLVYAWLGPPGQRASSGLPATVNVTAD